MSTLTGDNRRANLGEEWELSDGAWAEGEALLAARQPRGAITRYYYAAFHAARAALLTRESEPRSHGGVVSEFSRHFVRTDLIDSRLVRVLGRLESDRTEADYARAVVFTMPDAEEARDAARAFREAVRDLLVREQWMDHPGE